MHDTYTQSEKLFAEEFDLTEEIDSKLQSHIRTTFIKQFQAYVKDLEVEMKGVCCPELEYHDDYCCMKVKGFNQSLNLAIDKANNFIKYLEQK